MGIIVGLLSENGAHPSAKETIANMAAVQKHRDDSAIMSYDDGGFAGAMANKHNMISSGGQSGPEPFDDIVVMLDGIVLDVPKHRSYFEGKGYALPVAS